MCKGKNREKGKVMVRTRPKQGKQKYEGGRERKRTKDYGMATTDCRDAQLFRR
jgi:hypothetical protein